MDMVEWKNHLLEIQPGVMVDSLSKNDCSYIFLLVLGFAIPANYDDVGLNCGGLGVQKSNGMDGILNDSKIVFEI